MVHSKTRPSSIDRRRFLQYTWRALVSSLGLALVSDRAASAPRFSKNPFTLGVASGDPTPDGIVLWTRLAPEPAEPESLGAQAIRGEKPDFGGHILVKCGVRGDEPLSAAWFGEPVAFRN